MRRRGGILVHRVALASRVASGDPVGLLSSSSSSSSLGFVNRLEFVEEGDACVAARAGGRSNAPEERQPAEGTGGLGSGSANDKAGKGS